MAAAGSITSSRPSCVDRRPARRRRSRTATSMPEQVEVEPAQVLGGGGLDGGDAVERARRPASHGEVEGVVARRRSRRCRARESRGRRRRRAPGSARPRRGRRGGGCGGRGGGRRVAARRGDQRRPARGRSASASWAATATAASTHVTAASPTSAVEAIRLRGRAGEDGTTASPGASVVRPSTADRRSWRSTRRWWSRWRLTALTTALSEAVRMLSSRPTPQRTSPSGVCVST